MEHKTWLWKKKSSQKITNVNGKSDVSLVENVEEKDKILEFGKSLKDFTEELSDALTESNAKDDLLAKQAKVAEEAIAGWEKAEAETLSLKQELDALLLERENFEERIRNSDASLKECMHQFHILKEENQQTINEAATKISRGQEKAGKLEEKLAETNKKLYTLGDDNRNLNRILEIKEKTIEELNEFKIRSEEKNTAIAVKLAASEKTNASLVYEVSMLQKELEIRRKEREDNVKSADAAHKLHIQNINRISKLEKECQRFRVMVRNKLQGPTALAKMRTEVEFLNNAAEVRRKKANCPVESPRSRDFGSDYHYDATGESVASLTEKLQATEDENKLIKETLSKKNSELHSLQVMFARTTSKLSHAETQLEELPLSSPVSCNFPLRSISEDGHNEDNISCTGSWASALISELEHFRPGKPMTPTGRSSISSDMSLMDDFAEMEKLAIVSAGSPFGNSSMTSQQNETHSKFASPEAKGEAINNMLQSGLVKSVSKLVELVEAMVHGNINDPNQHVFGGDNGGSSPYHRSTSENRYVARVYLWETSELSTVLHRFIKVCTNLLHGNSDLKIFSEELASTLEWTIDHCFPLEDVSNMKEMFKNNKSHNRNEVEVTHSHSGIEKEKIDISEPFEFDTPKNVSLASGHEESPKSIANLHLELAALKKINTNYPTQNKKFINGDIDTQVTIAKVELDEYHQKFSALAVELEDENNRCAESEATSELPLHFESLATERSDSGQEQKQLRTDIEISTASKKLAECQETILNLGKQLKALASPSDESVIDKMISSPDDARIRRRLFDHMREDENAELQNGNSPTTKETLCMPQNPTAEAVESLISDLLANDDTDNLTIAEPSPVKSPQRSRSSNELGRHTCEATLGTLALLPKKQKGGIGFLEKLLMRRKRVTRN